MRSLSPFSKSTDKYSLTVVWLRGCACRVISWCIPTPPGLLPPPPPLPAWAPLPDAQHCTVITLFEHELNQWVSH